MAIKNLIGPGFVGSDTIEYLITRGLEAGAPAGDPPLIEQTTAAAAAAISGRGSAAASLAATGSAAGAVTAGD
mgnify:CR=1 FL=1